jgi:hypothetical protein
VLRAAVHRPLIERKVSESTVSGEWGHAVGRT